jgi:hypothetical protein
MKNREARDETPEKKPDGAGPPPSGDAERASAEPQGMKYVFKIAPVDPKNTLDFEDVADK